MICAGAVNEMSRSGTAQQWCRGERAILEIGRCVNELQDDERGELKLGRLQQLVSSKRKNEGACQGYRKNSQCRGRVSAAARGGCSKCSAGIHATNLTEMGPKTSAFGHMCVRTNK